MITLCDETCICHRIHVYRCTLLTRIFRSVYFSKCFSGCQVEIWPSRSFDPMKEDPHFQCTGRETENWCINKPIPLLTQTNVTYDNYISDIDYESYISNTFMDVNWAWVKPIGDVGYVKDSASSIKCLCIVELESIEYDTPRHSWILTSDFEESSGEFTD